MKTKSCCTPPSGRADQNSEPGAICVSTSRLSFPCSIIPGGPALLGTDRPIIPLDEEAPLRSRSVRPFRIMQTAVTNAMFEAFVIDTGYATEAEKFGWSYVFMAQLPDGADRKGADGGAPWWRQVEGANWRELAGPGTSELCEPGHPVIHISWNDAHAFAAWAGGRLPSEREWEHAARGGLGDVQFPWGDTAPNDSNFQPCNIWQGRFPDSNSEMDGYLTTAPVRSFDPNGFGLFNMIGNVWEWTCDPYKVRSLSKRAKLHAKRMQGTKILKGGSFLCHESYCYRYRIAARTGTTPDSTTTHQGFRLVFDDG